MVQCMFLFVLLTTIGTLLRTWEPPKFDKVIRGGRRNRTHVKIEARAYCKDEGVGGHSRTINGPDFMIIGAAKSGTHYLSELLGKHKEIGYTPVFDDNLDNRRINEISFLGEYPRRHEKNPEALEWYRSLFTCASQHHGSSTLLFEKSPNYLCDGVVPSYAYELFPHMKVILLLRNPANRLFSHINHAYRGGKRDCSGDERSCKDQKALNMIRNSRMHVRNSCTYENGTDVGQNCFCNVLRRGVYIDQVRRWREYFPQEQMMIIKSEDMYEHPRKIYDEVLEFLGVSLEYGKEVSFGYTKRHLYEQPSLRVRGKVYQFYRPYNERLYEYLGRNFEWEEMLHDNNNIGSQTDEL